MSPSDPPPAPQKSGLSGLAIAGLGCGALGLMVVIGLIVISLFLSRTTRVKDAAADFQKNPVKAAARPAVEADPDPDSTLPPRWVPVYPAAQSQAGGRKQETGDTLTGTYLARTKDAPEKVTDYFESTLKADGFETDITTSDANGNETAVLTAAKDEGKRKITVLANRVKGTTNLTISYQGLK